MCCFCRVAYEIVTKKSTLLTYRLVNGMLTCIGVKSHYTIFDNVQLTYRVLMRRLCAALQ